MRLSLPWVLAIALAGCGLDPPEPPPAPEFPAMPSVETVAVELSAETIETPAPVSGRSVEDATPADVLARAELLRAELELLRRFMGRPAPRTPRIRVTEAQPRVVYQQAKALFASANNLSFELSRTRASPPRARVATKTPPDVFRVLDRALQRVLISKRALKIEQAIKERPAAASTTPTDTFHALVAAATETNNLREQQTRPADVYQSVTSAVHAAAAIHATHPGALFPDEPPFEPNKAPSAAYELLLECYRITQQIAATRTLEIVELQVSEADARGATSQDVADLALLLDEEVRHLHAAWPNAKPPMRAFDPGLKFPSHVHQRARFLKALLEATLKRVQ